MSVADTDIMVQHGKAFGHGDLRNTSVDLRYLPNFDTNIKVKKKKPTGNDLKDFISR